MIYLHLWQASFIPDVVMFMSLCLYLYRVHRHPYVVLANGVPLPSEPCYWV
jgi:hypothetical protein